MGGAQQSWGAQQSQAPLQKALLNVKTAAAEVRGGGPLRAGWGRCAPGVKKCKNGCAVQPGGRGHSPGTGTMPRPRDRDNDPPPGTQPGAGGPVQGTEMSRGGLSQPHKHPGTPPRAHPPPHPPRPAHSLAPPAPRGGENTAPESPTGVGTPQKRKGERQSPRSLRTPSPKYCSVRGSTSRGGGALPGGGGSTRPPPPGKGTVGPRRACKQPGWGGKQSPWGTPTPAKRPGSVVGGPRVQPLCSVWDPWSQEWGS